MFSKQVSHRKVTDLLNKVFIAVTVISAITIVIGLIVISSAIIVQGKIKEFQNLPEGFILSPWAKSNEIWCISGSIESVAENQVFDFLRDIEFQLNSTQSLSITYNEFENEVLKIQKEIEVQNFEKAVASRIDVTSETFDIEKIATWFQLLLENHQNADGTVNVPAALQPFLGMKKFELA
mgnify:CR=1 FL=1